MSIASAHYAEYANKKREEWLDKLLYAHLSGDEKLIELLIYEMSTFEFSE